MRYLEKKGFPVPKTMLTKSGESIFETEVDGEMKLIVLMEFIDGDEPELESCAAEVGALVGRFHQLMEEVFLMLLIQMIDVILQLALAVLISISK